MTKVIVGNLTQGNNIIKNREIILKLFTCQITCSEL